MAAKNYFACFCRLLKHAPQTTKWKKESLKLRSTGLTFEKNVLQSACTTTMHQKSSESSRNDSLTKCCQEESRNNYFLNFQSSTNYPAFDVAFKKNRELWKK